MPKTSTICVCGESKSTLWHTVQDIPIVTCASCGIRRVASIDKEAYTDRYESGSYHSEDRAYDTGHPPHKERFAHDLEVAMKRLHKMERFGPPDHRVLLDVGCSNGAFMAAAEKLGYAAYGCDLSTSAVPDELKQFTFQSRLEDLRGSRHIVRRNVDIITFNDVLEHIPDPRVTLRTAQGLLKRDGLLVVEVPDMGCQQALELGPKFHHVKPNEHLWYFTSTQLRELLEREGFYVVWMDAPITGKVTAYAMPVAKVEQVTVYGPPGIGDIIWTMPKLKVIRDREAPCRINYVVCVAEQTKLATRSNDFLLLSDLVDTCEFRSITLPRDVGNANPAEPVYELFANDYFEPQKGLAEYWRPELPSDWDLQLNIPDAAIKQVKARFGGHTPTYAAIYMSSHVWNRVAADPDWTKKDWALLCIGLSEAGIKPVILGAGWDCDYARDVAAEIVNLGHDPNKVWINLTGRTTIALMLAYLFMADVTIGIANGLPMISATMGWPTFIMWPVGGIAKTPCQWTKEFCFNWLPPHIRKLGNYRYESFGAVDPLSAVQTVKDLIFREKEASV